MCGAVGLSVLALPTPTDLLLLPIATLATLAAVLFAPTMQRWDVYGLCVVIVASTSAIGNSAGGPSAFQILFGGLMVGYVALWYGLTTLAGRTLVRSWPDLAYVLFIGAGVLFWAPLGVLNGAAGTDLRSDLTILLALMLFLPAREVCTRYRFGPSLLAALLIGLGVFATLDNLFRLYGVLTGATELYEIVDVRISSGEIQITGALFLALLHAATTSSRALRGLLLVVSALLLGGLVLAKSRGPWLTAIIGLAVALALMPPHRRGQTVRSFVVTLVAVAALSWFALRDQLSLIAVGLGKRLGSISTAATQDISLLNRYAETRAAWEAILESPVFGFGWGVPVVRFDWIAKMTFDSGFLHNGYVWLWHRVGLIGLVCFGSFLASVLYLGGRSARSGDAPDTDRISAAAGTGSLLAFLILAIPSNPFVVLDQVIVVVLTLALLSGLAMRRHAPPVPS